VKELTPNSRNFVKVNAMLLNLALNHSVLISDRGYSASSPDELALVNAAKFMGYEFIGRENRDNSVTISINGKKETWFLL
jgi:magnesium-transporting ATPase (P-type)